MPKTSILDKHQGRWLSAILGSLAIIWANPSRPLDVFYIIGLLVGAALVAGLVAGLSFLVSVVIRKRMTDKQVRDTFFGAYAVIAGLQLLGAILSAFQ